jgi:hypothetical protein
MGSDRLSFLPRRLEITSPEDKLVCYVGFGALMAVALLSNPVQGNLVLSQVALFFLELVHHSEVHSSGIYCRVVKSMSSFVSEMRAASIALMMESARTSETSVDIDLITRLYNSEDSELHTRRRENLKSHIGHHSLCTSIQCGLAASR